MFEIAQKAANAATPSKAQLTQEDFELLNLMDALEAVLEVPYLLTTRYTEEQVAENMRSNPALGSRDFIKNVQDRSSMLVTNLWRRETKDQNKKVWIAASGAGTGKTTTMEQGVSSWAGFPFKSVAGSDFAGVKPPEGTSVFEFFAERVRKAVYEFRINGARCKYGFLYLDDFDRALEKLGMFASSLATECRAKYFLFCKDMGDPAAATICASEPALFSYHLAPGRYMPIDFRHIHLGKSVNNLPAELLPETADTAMSSRIFNLNPTYADEHDRMHIGMSYYLPLLTRKVLDFYGDGCDAATGQLAYAPDPVTGDLIALDGETQLARANVELAKNAIRRLVEVDIDIYTSKYKTKLGIRGLKDLLDRYLAHIVNNKLTRPLAKTDLFAITDGDFDVAKVVKSIEDYNKVVNQQMSDVEDAATLASVAAEERVKVSRMVAEGEVRDSLLARFDLIATTKELSQKAVLLEDARFHAALVCNRVRLPTEDEAGARLKSKLGYFRSSSKSGGRRGPVPAHLQRI